MQWHEYFMKQRLGWSPLSKSCVWDWLKAI